MTDERDDLVHEVEKCRVALRGLRREYDELARSRREIMEQRDLLDERLAASELESEQRQDRIGELESCLQQAEDNRHRMIALGQERGPTRTPEESYADFAARCQIALEAKLKRLHDAPEGCADTEDPTCTVLLDGSRRMVPWSPCCAMSARGWLGVPRGWSVRREEGGFGVPTGEPLSFKDGFQFHEAERYVLADFVDPEEELDDEPKESWENDPEGWKKG